MQEVESFVKVGVDSNSREFDAMADRSVKSEI